MFLKEISKMKRKNVLYCTGNDAFDVCGFVWLLRKSKKVKENARFLIYLIFGFKNFILSTLNIFKIYLITCNTKIHVLQFDWINKSHVAR